MTRIEKIILYKHGIGYFERSAEVTDDQILELEFKKEEMNDVLKSLAVFDADGGSIAGISYDAQKPLDEELADISLNLPKADVLSGLLNEFKGTRVELDLGGRKVEGEILGLEKKITRSGDEIREEKRLALYAAEGRIVNFDLFEVQDIVLKEEKARRDLDRLLKALAYWRKKERKKLNIFARGNGERRVNLSYAVSAPVWKTSYRVLLRENEAPYLQGWALVDNTGHEDWENVRLSLVAGLPVSFIHDLYTPRRQSRPVIAVETGPMYGPPEVERGVQPVPAASIDMSRGAPEAAMAPAAFGEKLAGKRGRMQKRMRNEFAEDDLAMMDMMEDAEPMGALGGLDEEDARASGREVSDADYYVYDINEPITVQAGQSALAPIVSGSFEGGRVALYNRDMHERNPFTALRFKNTLGALLEGGPVTVYTTREYMGECMMETVKPDAEIFLPFAVELGCRLGINHKSKQQQAYEALSQNGLLIVSHHVFGETIYDIDNSGNQRELDLFLDHEFKRGWDLDEEDAEHKPFEKTDRFYRFRLKIEPGGVRKFVVKERGKRDISYHLGDISPDNLQTYIEKNYLTPEAARAIRGVIDIGQELSRVMSAVKETNEEGEELTDGQERLRENLKALGDRDEEKQLRSRYIKQLNESEDRLAELTALMKKLREEKKALERKRKQAIKKISFKKILEN